MGTLQIKRQFRAPVGMALLLGAALAWPGCVDYDAPTPCESDAACGAEQACDLARGFCRPLSCVRACEVRECGDDGCGLSCGTCLAGESCSAEGQCLGTCAPDCTGRECGDDGCGGSCGACGVGEVCTPGGMCLGDYPCCGTRECGPDPCLGESCGTCSEGELCDASGRCQPCTPDCAGRECGLDPVCGLLCGECLPGQACSADGMCEGEPPCCGMLECGPDPCAGTSCGTCGLDEVCEAGACRSSLRLMGEACQESNECETGWCLRYADGTGYCTARDCLRPEDCVNHAAGETALMCCVDVGGDFRVCLKIEPGYTCGIQDKTCGQSCVGQLDSACDPNHHCLTTQETYCSHNCVTNADCNDCQSEDPDVFFQCQVVDGGDSACVASADQSCTASSQCSAGEVCAPHLDPTGHALQGYCGARGALPAGAECSEDDDQCMGMCVNAHCSEVCESDGDCPEQSSCTSVSLCRTMEGTGECAVCTESFPAIRMCLWYPIGQQPAGAACAFGAINPDAGDCLPGLACLGVDAAEEPCATAGDCDSVFQGNWNSECVTGACGNPDHCGFSFCSPRCALDGSCEQGFQPALVGEDCYCLPAPEPGTAQQGDPCPFDLTNADAESCASGLICLGIPADLTSLACVSADDCLVDFQASWNPDCVDVAGSGRCGASFCSSPCDAQGNCPAGAIPQTVSGSCYCIPDDAGASAAGDPCPFGDTNIDADLCQAGLACLGFSVEAGSPDCPNGDADCVTALGAAFNPDCVDFGGAPKCGASFCSAECALDGSCETGFVPQAIEATCYCIPADVGGSAAGEPCPFDQVNADADACAVGLTCLGISQDPIGTPCPAGVADCLAYYAAYWNLDCVSGGCGASFCSPECTAGACDVGFDPYDIEGACYCVPNQ